MGDATAFTVSYPVLSPQPRPVYPITVEQRARVLDAVSQIEEALNNGVCGSAFSLAASEQLRKEWNEKCSRMLATWEN